MKINIGGGLKRFEGFVNVDADPNTKPEYLHNLEKEKLPFEDSTVEEVKAHHILEHIHDLGHVIKEIYRVCKNGAVVDIAFPHHFARNFFGDYTHCRALTVEMFKQFSKK
jgi:predicted SAM-dependent methyltransferase